MTSFIADYNKKHKYIPVVTCSSSQCIVIFNKCSVLFAGLFDSPLYISFSREDCVIEHSQLVVFDVGTE